MTFRPALYRLYGLRIRSPWVLAGPREQPGRRADVELRRVRDLDSHLAVPGIRPSPRRWFEAHPLPDGRQLVRWRGILDALISADGSLVLCKPRKHFSSATVDVYLLGHVLSFCLIARGVEPFHATTVASAKGAVALVGDCGFGKTSLGAAFLAEGFRLVSDDLLVVEDRGGRFWAAAGAPRIKLFPAMARRVLPRVGGAVRMNPLTSKLVIRLAPPLWSAEAAPLVGLVFLEPPHRTPSAVRIRRLVGRQALTELIRNTFNTVLVGPARSEAVLSSAAAIVKALPAWRILYPRTKEGSRKATAAIREKLRLV